MLTSMQKLDYLRKVPVFSDIPVRDLALIAMICSEEDLNAGHTICEAGDPGDELFIITSGEIGVFRQGEAELMQIATIPTFGCVGESSLFTDQPRNATLITISPCHLLILNQTMVFELIHDHPSIALNILKTVLLRPKT